MSSDDEKQAAAAAALAYVEPGMKLGLGSGSTASRFVALLGEKVARGLRIVGVPTSEATRRQAEALGIPLTTLEETPQLDIVIDGADEVDGRCGSSRAAAARCCARRSSRPRARAWW